MECQPRVWFERCSDPLIHQDILLTNGDLPSEDGLVNSGGPPAELVGFKG